MYMKIYMLISIIFVWIYHTSDNRYIITCDYYVALKVNTDAWLWGAKLHVYIMIFKLHFTDNQDLVLEHVLTRGCLQYIWGHIHYIGGRELDRMR